MGGQVEGPESTHVASSFLIRLLHQHQQLTGLCLTDKRRCRFATRLLGGYLWKACLSSRCDAYRCCFLRANRPLSLKLPCSLVAPISKAVATSTPSPYLSDCLQVSLLPRGFLISHSDILSFCPASSQLLKSPGFLARFFHLALCLCLLSAKPLSEIVLTSRESTRNRENYLIELSGNTTHKQFIKLMGLKSLTVSGLHFDGIITMSTWPTAATRLCFPGITLMKC